MRKKSVLITGGAGFIGSHLADALFKLGYKVRILDKLTPPVHQQKKWPKYLSKKYELIKGDVVKKKDWLRALKDIDYVYHLAAYQDYLPDFSNFFQTNTFSTTLLYELICDKGLSIKKVIYGSSQSVYGEGKYQCGKRFFYPAQRTLRQLKNKEWNYRCPDGKTAKFLPMREDNLLKAHNSYGLSKIAAESAALQLGKRYNIPTVVLRYSIVQGSRQSPFNAYSGALRIFVSQAALNHDLTIFEDGQQKRDFVNIKDVIRATVFVLKNKKADFQAFNVGGGKAYTVLEFAKLVQRIVNPRSKIKFTNEFRMGDTRNAVSDIGKLKKLGWRPNYSTEDSIKDYSAWFKTLSYKRDFTKDAYKKMKKLGVIRK